MRRTLSAALALIAALAIGSVWADRPGRTPPGWATAGGLGAERGIARIACRGRQDNVWHRSRGIFVDTGALRTSRAEIVLSTAHSLPSDPETLRRDCWIIGVYGAAFRVVDAWRPDDPDAAPTHDWAVLLIAGIAQDALSRLPIRPISPAALHDLAVQENPVRLMMSVAAADQANCTFTPDVPQGAPRIEVGVFLHTCRSAAGLSGSPILIAFDGEPVVIGFHLGHRMKPVRSDGPLFVSVGRAIDAEIANAIHRAAERATSLSALCANAARRRPADC